MRKELDNMRKGLDTSKVFVWCKNHPLVLGWIGGSAIISTGVGMLSASPGAGILTLGISILFGVMLLAFGEIN